MASNYSNLSRRSLLQLAVATSLAISAAMLSARPTAAFLLGQAPLRAGKMLNVKDYGADNTGKTYATANIQNAINTCNPGDTLLIPPGTYLLNDGLTLKSDMKIILSKDALLQANTDGVWLRSRSHILHGKGVRNVTIEGGGAIDGGGLVYKRNKGVQPGRGIQFEGSSNITLRNLTIRNIPTFGVDFQTSENVTVDGLTIRGRGFDNLLGSSDGLDIESSAHVRISNCNIEVGDDALCLKSNAGFPCHDIRIRDCILASTCNGFKIGTSTVADVYDVVAENIVVNKHSNPGNGNPVASGDCIAAIAIESNDHHRTYDITCRNFTINSSYCPIYFALQNRQSNEKGLTGQLDNILIENVNCLHSTQPIIFNWQPDGENKMKNVTLSNVTVHNYGTKEGAALRPMNGNYPDANKHGEANAYGIWARGIKGLALKNCKFYDEGGSKREKFIFDSSVEDTIPANLLLAQNNTQTGLSTPKSPATVTPCMDVLDRFTAPNVPALSPEEEPVQFGNPNAVATANLPGNGLAQHPMLYVGENCNTMFLIKDGKAIWSYSTGKGPEYDDVWMLSNGNILFTRMKYIALITPDKKVLWRYDCNVSKDAQRTEVHTCQPIGLDKVMFVVNGLPPKLMVVNTKTGAVEVEHELPYIQPPDPNRIHGQFRRARVTAQGTYLVSLLNMNRVVEYDKNFKEIWKYEIPSPWAAIRLKNGNTLITDEKESLTREVNSKGETVWEFNCLTDLPTEYQFASAPQSCTRLSNGNTIFASRGKGGQGPQLIEVTRDKKVVWVLQDWKNIGDATAVQILDDPGIPEIPGQSEH